MPQGSPVRIDQPDTALTAPCRGPTYLTEAPTETVLLRDRRNHAACERRHAALVGWALDLTTTTQGAPQ